jgi:hypothetical protein
MEESTAGDQPEDISTFQSQLSGTAQNAMAFTNRETATVTSSGLNFAGFLLTDPSIPLSNPPAAQVAPSQSDFYAEEGIGNITSFHIDHTAGSKKCHFNTATFPNGGICQFIANGQSQGTTFATCTAQITFEDPQTCSQVVQLIMQ